MFPNIERCAEPFKNIDLVWLIGTATGRAIMGSVTVGLVGSVWLVIDHLQSAQNRFPALI